MYLTSYTSIKSISRIWVVVLRLRGTSSVTEKERASVSFLPFQKKKLWKEPDGSKWRCRFFFELHLTLYGDRLLNGFVCQKKKPTFGTEMDFPMSLEPAKGKKNFFWVAHRYLLRDVHYYMLILRGRCIGVPSIQDQKSILTNKMKPSFSAKGQTLSNLLAKYFLLSTRDSSCRGVDAL